MVIITGNSVKTTLAKVQSFQKQLGASLPQDYVDFLLEHNGGSVTPDLCSIYGSRRDDVCTVHYLYGIDPGEASDLTWNLEVLVDRIPSGFLPIGNNPGDDQFCLKFSGEASGCIFLWDRAIEAVESIPSIKGTHFVAPGFSDFLASLREE